MLTLRDRANEHIEVFHLPSTDQLACAAVALRRIRTPERIGVGEEVG
jgi:hypothetical protein